MKKRNSLFIMAAILTTMMTFMGCDEDEEEANATTTYYTPATVKTVTVEQVRGKTGSVNVAGTAYQLVFGSTGELGTVKKSGSEVGTFVYDGDTLSATVDGMKNTYLKNTNGKYYLLDKNRLENSRGSGLIGKWIWKNGTPTHPLAPKYYYYDYYLFFADMVFQNPKSESMGYRGVTWKSSNGMVTLYDEDGNVGVEKDGTPAVWIYDGTYLYLANYLLTLD